VILAGTAATAGAAPHVAITSPLSGSVSNIRTPSFSGVGEEGSEVVLSIHSGPTVTGPVVENLGTVISAGGTWSVGPAEPLIDGVYTAQAAQTNAVLEPSPPVTFTVDTAAPTVTLSSPESPSSNTTPTFSGTASDTTPVTVQIHVGATAKGTMISTATATGTGGKWISGRATPALSVGQYTAVAIQTSSLAGNPAGRSGPVTFTVVAPPVIPPPAPPAAYFTWFPPVPQAGEPVSLVSNASDPTSAITGVAWDLAGTGAFQTGAPVLVTTFSAVGAHVVRLRVTNALGLSNVATATINVVGRRVPLMQPFPVVRIASRETASGVELLLLKVQQMPAGARITVRCRGRHCPLKVVKRVAASTRRGVSPVEFRVFERSLRFGVTLEILISKPGEIGKYTRLSILRGVLPERSDMCLDLTGRKPLMCPSS
jgi:hypothetical protein